MIIGLLKTERCDREIRESKQRSVGRTGLEMENWDEDNEQGMLVGSRS